MAGEYYINLLDCGNLNNSTEHVSNKKIDYKYTT